MNTWATRERQHLLFPERRVPEGVVLTGADITCIKNPQRVQVLIGDTLPNHHIVTPTIETLHSTNLYMTLWEPWLVTSSKSQSREKLGLSGLEVLLLVLR